MSLIVADFKRLFDTSLVGVNHFVNEYFDFYWLVMNGNVCISTNCKQIDYVITLNMSYGDTKVLNVCKHLLKQPKISNANNGPSLHSLQTQWFKENYLNTYPSSGTDIFDAGTTQIVKYVYTWSEMYLNCDDWNEGPSFALDSSSS
jgi:hypothetical protein